jgi:GDP-4-dehydro-6-deoxy-D-mannose reductase
VRFLVTGAAGFVGRHLTRQLLSDGHEVAALVHPSDLSAKSLPLGVSTYPVDILDDGAVDDLLRDVTPGAIVHLAAFSNPEGSLKRANETLMTNIIGTENLLAAALDSGRFPLVLLVGSSQQYGRVEPSEQPIREDRVQEPLTPYAVSKASQELLGKRYFLSEKLPVYLTRSFNHTGPGQAEGYVCSSFARQVVEAEKGLKEPFIGVGNLEAQRDFTDVRDVARAYRAILESGQPGRPYNVCSATAVSIREILETLIDLSGAEVEVRVEEDRYHALDAPLLVGDHSRLREDTGWAPERSLRQTLSDLLEDWRERI